MTPVPFAPLPALRKLADLRDHQPVIVIDTREQTPLVPTRLEYVRGTLTTGDYSVLGLEDQFAIERKSIADLVQCCKSGTKAAEGERERFERELCRMRGMRFARLLIVGKLADIEAGAYRSEIKPQAVIGSMNAWNVRHVPVVIAQTPEIAARHVEDWAWWYSRECVRTVNAMARAEYGKEGA